MVMLEDAGLQPRLFAGTVPDPTADSLGAGLTVWRERAADSVIGFGGQGLRLSVVRTAGLPVRMFLPSCAARIAVTFPRFRRRW
ncbi:hypothetical protein [Streptomyces akebiae]|uniref:Uncharacterized protein n=1 Tax=Streptomyces akebiae TaxID=2865673 RepID=A0ABX8Y365_9ACTN|nr:hypothetical protein [Streptomyces akebiae]QYX82305.1 hypothetical protein K1J60_42325 [Streptomyces akebiae]